MKEPVRTDIQGLSYDLNKSVEDKETLFYDPKLTGSSSKAGVFEEV